MSKLCSWIRQSEKFNAWSVCVKFWASPPQLSAKHYTMSKARKILLCCSIEAFLFLFVQARQFALRAVLVALVRLTIFVRVRDANLENLLSDLQMTLAIRVWRAHSKIFLLNPVCSFISPSFFIVYNKKFACRIMVPLFANGDLILSNAQTWGGWRDFEVLFYLLLLVIDFRTIIICLEKVRFRHVFLRET